jgi:hypothetical protein
VCVRRWSKRTTIRLPPDRTSKLKNGSPSQMFDGPIPA